MDESGTAGATLSLYHNCGANDCSGAVLDDEALLAIITATARGFIDHRDQGFCCPAAAQTVDARANRAIRSSSPICPGRSPSASLSSISSTVSVVYRLISTRSQTASGLSAQRAPWATDGRGPPPSRAGGSCRTRRAGPRHNWAFPTRRSRIETGSASAT